MAEDYDLAGQVIGCAMKVHRALGPGFLEIVYRNALCVELKQQGLAFTTEEPIKVRYAGVEVGSYFADIFVEGQLITELKAVEKLLVIHEVQVVNYLTATGIDDGLLLNLGSRSLDYRRKSRLSPQRRSRTQT